MLLIHIMEWRTAGVAYVLCTATAMERYVIVSCMSAAPIVMCAARSEQS